MTRSLQELLLSIATGGPVRARVHDCAEYLCGRCGERPSREHSIGKCEEGQWIRVPSRVEQRPGEHPGLWEELQTTIARLSRMSGSAGTGARPAESAVPYHRKASEVAHRLGNAVTTWARLVAEENPQRELTARTVPEAARWLARWLEVNPDLLGDQYVEAHTDLSGVVRAAERVIDHGPGKVYAGPCHQPLTEEAAREDWRADVLLEGCCPEHLYATVGKKSVICRSCGTRYDVADRQAVLAEELEPILVGAAEAAPVLAWMTGKDITRNNIAAWKRDGRVEVHDGRWPYRFGDLLALARDMKPRKKEGSAA